MICHDAASSIIDLSRRGGGGRGDQGRGGHGQPAGQSDAAEAASTSAGSDGGGGGRGSGGTVRRVSEADDEQQRAHFLGGGQVPRGDDLLFRRGVGGGRVGGWVGGLADGGADEYDGMGEADLRKACQDHDIRGRILRVDCGGRLLKQSCLLVPTATRLFVFL